MMAQLHRSKIIRRLLAGGCYLLLAASLLRGAQQATTPHPVEKFSWGFHNFKSTDEATGTCADEDHDIKDYDWELFRDTYTGIPPHKSQTSFDILFYEEIYETKLARPGNCYGMSLLSLLMYEKGGHLGFCYPALQYSGDLSDGCSYTDDDGGSASTGLGPSAASYPTLRSTIEQMHGHQVHLPSVRHYFDLIVKGYNRDANYAFGQVQKYKQAVLSITKDLSPAGGGHSVLAYDAVVDPSDSNKKYIYFYDPNYSWADDDYKKWYRDGYNKITVYFENAMWKWKCIRDWTPIKNNNVVTGYTPTTDQDRIWSGDKNSGGNLIIIPSSVASPRSRTPTSLGMNLGQAYSKLILSGDGASLVQMTDAAGQRLFEPGTMNVDIDDETGMRSVMPFVPTHDDSKGDQDIQLFVCLDGMSGPVTVDVDVGDAGYALTIDGAAGTLKVTATGGTDIDRLKVIDAGTEGPQVVLLNSAGVQQYRVDFTLNIEAGMRSRRFSVDALALPDNAPVTLAVVEHMKGLAITSAVAPVSCDVTLAETMDGQETVKELADVTVAPGQSKMMGPGDWSDLADGGMTGWEEPVSPQVMEDLFDLGYGVSPGALGPDFDGYRDIEGPAGGETAYDAETGMYTQVSEGAGFGMGGDQGQFAYQYVTGDFEWTIEMTGPLPEGDAQAGLMVRQDCSCCARFSFLMPHGWLWREHHGDSEAPVEARIFSPQPDAPVQYLKLVRHGSTFYGFSAGPDGQWRPVGANAWADLDPDMPLLVGVASAGGGQPVAVQFKVHQASPIDPPIQAALEDDNIDDGTVIHAYDFTGQDEASPAGFSVQKREGDGEPVLWNNRLQMSGVGLPNASASAFSQSILPDMGQSIYRFDFDLYLERGEGETPSGGVAFVLMNGDDTEQVGHDGEGVGYDGLGLAPETDHNDSHNSLSVAFDVQAGAPAGGGGDDYRVTINAQNQVNAVMLASEDLPDAFADEGVQVRILYNRGRVQVFMRPGGSEDSFVQVLSAALLPLTFGTERSDGVFGFTAGTGEVPVAAAVDNLTVITLGCQDITEVALIDGVPEAAVPPGTVVILDGSGSHGGFGDAHEPVTHKWRVVSGDAGIDGPDDGPTVTIQTGGPSDVTVELAVDDGHCESGATTEAVFQVRQQTGTEGQFSRGDANADGGINLADAIKVLSYLFADDAPPPCLDASDANDDGKIDLADPIGILSYLFSNPIPLPAPFDGCGLDETDDSLDCEDFSPCK